MSRRGLTPEEEDLRPVYFDDAYFSLEDNLVHAQLFEQEATSETGGFPWKYASTNEHIPEEDFERFFPHIHDIDDLNWTTLVGSYRGKTVSWSFRRDRWVYQNQRAVYFPSTPDSSEEQAQVTELLESATKTVATLLRQVSQPQTPVQVPGALPETPGPSRLPIPVSPVRVSTPPRRRASPSSQAPPALPTPPTTVLLTAAVPRGVLPLVPAQAPVQAPPAAPVAPMAANPQAKILGAAPEPFDGKATNANAFWNNLDNYFYLNSGVFDTDNKKISTSLTYFRIGTPAGDWAQDKQKAALTLVPIDFGTWADFKASFEKHFIPAHTKLDATNAMYTSRMGARPFNEWYQEWSTHAARSGANEETQMFAFRKAIPMALHTKLVGITPQPATLADLVEKARDLDRIWRLYGSQTTNRNTSRRPTNTRAMFTEEDASQVNATTTNPQRRGKLTSAEKARRVKEKLCFYCGKPNHTLKECKAKTEAMNQARSGKPRGNNDFRARGATTQEETYDETPDEHPAQIGAIYREINAYDPNVRPQSAPLNEDF